MHRFMKAALLTGIAASLAGCYRVTVITGAQVNREASRTVRFRPGEALKGALN